MKVSQLQNEIMEILKEGGCDSPSFDTICLLEDMGNLGRGQVVTSLDMIVPDETATRVLKAAHQRAAGYPLQYLLGTWDFLDLTLEVGEGVLIPRTETELLCEIVAEKIKCFDADRSVEIWDLCAGTGCVGLGIASLIKDKDVHILEVELSDKAFLYLEKNIQKYHQYHAKAIKADILGDFDRFDGEPSVIVSNPPYIPKGDLKGLQREVQCEPAMALDGDDDGLRFYRVIADKWIPKLSKGGIVAVEVGIGQAQIVSNLFMKAGLSNIECIKDFSGINRVVIGVAI